MPQNVIANFTNHIKNVGYSKSSQYQIPHCVAEFVQQCKTEITQIEQQHILIFYDYLQTRKLKKRNGVLSETMISHYIFALKLFFNWLEQTEQIDENPMSNLVFKTPTKNQRQPLTQDQVQQLFTAANTNKETAILHLFYSCGLRRTEAENLKISDINFAKNLLYVRAGKGAKRRAIPMSEKVKTALENYCKTKRPKINEPAFMLNTNNKKMSGQSYNNALKTILHKTEISENISLHHLRHSIATHLLENGLSIENVRDFLGHSQLETTQIYVQVTQNQIKDL